MSYEAMEAQKKGKVDITDLKQEIADIVSEVDEKVAIINKNSQEKHSKMDGTT